jgi:hypothetical protein
MPLGGLGIEQAASLESTPSREPETTNSSKAARKGV